MSQAVDVVGQRIDICIKDQETTINLHFDDEATTLSSKVRLAGSKEGRFEDGGIHAYIA